MYRAPLFALLAIAARPALFAQGVWDTRAAFPVEATEVSAASLNGKMYVVCGITPSGSRNSLYAYDPVRDTWEERAPAPISGGGGDHCNFAAANGRLYLLGALRFGSSFVDGDTHEYDPVADRWRTVARMPTPRGAGGVAVIGARIYVIGGAGGSGSEVEAFDTATQQWSRLAGMPTPRDHLTAQAVDGKIYALAGRNNRGLVANTEEFDLSRNSWRQRAPIPTPRGGVASGLTGGGTRILVLGGEGPSGTPERTYRQNEEYDPAADFWRPLPDLPTPRHGLQGATIDGRVFLASGGPREGATYSNVHEVYIPPPPSRPTFAPGGIRNAASGRGGIGAGGLVSLFGENFSRGEQVASRFPLPTRMNGVSVTASGRPVPLLYVGPGQINLQLPFGVLGSSSPAGTIRFAINNAGAAGEELEALVGLEAGALFSIDGSGAGQGAVVLSGTGQLASASRPARRGDVVEIYCNALGPVDNPPPPGMPAGSTPLARTLAVPQVRIGGQPAEVLFSGLVPGLVGLYQVNARIAMNASVGPAVPVQIGTPNLSNAVTIAVAE